MPASFAYRSAWRWFWLAAVSFSAVPALAMIDVDDTSIDGVPVWYASDRSVPVVHIILTFDEAGTASDPAALGGRAMLAARVLGEGAGPLDGPAFHKALESRAIRFSARAGRDDLTVEIHALKEELPEAARLLTLALTAPRNEQNAIADAKEEQFVALKASRESPAAIAQRAWNEAMYGTHPYARDGIGDEQSIHALARTDLESYRARYVTRANLQIAAAGDISASELKDALSPLVEALPEAFFPERDKPGVTLDGKAEMKRIAYDAPQSVVVFGGAGLSRADKRYYAAYLMNTALGSGSLSSRLMKAVRVKKGLVYGIGTSLVNGDAADSFLGQFATRNASVDDAVGAVKDTVQKLAEQGLSARECEEVKREVVQGFMLNLDSTDSIARVIAMMMRYNLGRDYLEKRAHLFEKVRCKDIQAEAQALLKPEHWLFVVVGKESAGAQEQ